MNRDVQHWQVKKSAVTSSQGVVAAQHELAARAGAAMLDAGGNAMDAAVAAAFALAAVEPWMCGLGGSGYMVAWSAASRRADVIDFQGMLPGNIRLDDYPVDPGIPETIMGFPGVVDRRNVVGPLSITVPGAVMGLSRGLERFGRLGLDSVLGPAIQLARRGLPCNWFTTLQVALAAGDLARDPEASRIYLPGGMPPAPEQFLPLGRLADTLERLAADGPQAFYSGSLGEALVADLSERGSRITLEDLAAYELLEHDSPEGRHRGAILHTAGPTSGGPRLIETLAEVAREMPQPGTGPDGESWTIYARALDKAWRSHKARLGRGPDRQGCTSSLSAVDAEGNMVALTYTLLNRFGSCVVLPRTGILMNNAVSYFDMRPGYPTTMEGRKRINASNICPTIATRNGEALFAIGASGANHIQPCVTQIAALMLDFGMSLEEAFNHPRIDASDRGSIRVDPRMGEAVLGELGRHFELEVAQLLVFPKLYACPSGVSRDPASGTCHGINDPSQPIGGAAAPAPFILDPGDPAGGSARGARA
ncbi:MAG: gamma-glutamyltransferase [Geminicoccaceae bacterium]|nr:gamma-glutamyltransferase [Geminicoccaceae bacterium]